MFWWNSSGEIQANKKLVSKSIVLLQPFDRQLVFFGPNLLMKCCSWLIYTKCKLTLWHLCFFSVPFAGLTTITFIGKAEFSCVTCSMLVCYLLQRISIIQTCRMLCVRLYDITWLVSTSDFFVVDCSSSWRGSQLCVFSMTDVKGVVYFTYSWQSKYWISMLIQSSLIGRKPGYLGDNSSHLPGRDALRECACE